ALELVRSSSEALLTILNDILDYSKIEAEHLELESIPFDPPKVVHATVTLLSVLARENHLELTVDVLTGVHLLVRGYLKTQLQAALPGRGPRRGTGPRTDGVARGPPPARRGRQRDQPAHPARHARRRRRGGARSAPRRRRARGAASRRDRGYPVRPRHPRRPDARPGRLRARHRHPGRRPARADAAPDPHIRRAARRRR